jgi:hypothetical protein
MCYNKVVYGSDKKSATVEAKCRKHDSITKIEYNWNNEGFQSEATYNATTSLTDELTLIVKVTDGNSKEFTITAEPTNFVW